MIFVPEMLIVNPLPSILYRERPEGVSIDTLIIHSMYNDQSEDWYSPHACKELLDHHQVSAHYLIDRSGRVYHMVPDLKRARHAGNSRMPLPSDGRDEVNDFSIGIELIATETSGYTDVQMVTLAALTSRLSFRHALDHLYGHADIAPDRKTDPHLFDWDYYQSLLHERGVLTRIGNFRSLLP